MCTSLTDPLGTCIKYLYVLSVLATTNMAIFIALQACFKEWREIPEDMLLPSLP